jgi:Arabinose-binding domain of AraC transcription regulator, N-term
MPRRQPCRVVTKSAPHRKLPSQTTHTVLAAYGRLLVKLVAHWRVSPNDLLAFSGVAVADLREPMGRLPLAAMLFLAERARRLTDEPGLGWYMGLESKLSMYAHIGFGMLSAETLRDAIELLIRFSPVLGTALTLRLEESGPRDASIVIEENVDLGESRDFVLGGFVTGMWHLGSRLSGSIATSTAELAIPEPQYFRRIDRTGPPIRFLPPGLRNSGRLGPSICFGQSSNRLIFRRAKLDSPLPMADEAANELTRELCEKSLATLRAPVQAMQDYS